MWGLEKYRDLFGRAGSTAGLRKYRVFGIAILDVSVVVLFGAILTELLRRVSGRANFWGLFWRVLLVLFIFGIIVHRVFGVRTTVDKMIFGSGGAPKKVE